MVLAKYMEIDDKIPLISKIRKISSSIYSTEDIRKAEEKICALFDWNLQFCTLIDLF